MVKNTAQMPADRQRLIGLAMERGPLVDSIGEILLPIRSYALERFDDDIIGSGKWPDGNYYCVLASCGAFENYRDHVGDDEIDLVPIALVLNSYDVPRHRESLILASTFIIADRNLHRLPNILALIPYRLALVPDAEHFRPSRVNERLSMLTDLRDSERQVLAELSRGSGNQQIAHRLNLSLSNVKDRIRQIYNLFGFRNRTDAGVFAATFLTNAQSMNTSFDGRSHKEG